MGVVIFLDVGAHEGQTLEEVVDPRYGFERIHAFEPMPRQYEVLVERFGEHPNVTLHGFGLADFNGSAPLYGSNDGMEASLYPAKRDVDETVATLCPFVQASVMLAQLPGEFVVKLNCEGAEVPILDDLVLHGWTSLERIHRLLIDFDVRKIPGREGDAERVLAELGAVGFTRYDLAEDVMVGATHQERIRAWLDGVLSS